MRTRCALKTLVYVLPDGQRFYFGQRARGSLRQLVSQGWSYTG